MKTLKRLHRETSVRVKIALPIVIFIIIPLIISLSIIVANTRNIIF
jgi:hypothetical protein